MDKELIEKMRKELFYFGTYDSWKEAEKVCLEEGWGYDNSIIFDKVKEATQKVRRGQGVYEQDGVVYKKTLFNYELVASLLYIYAREGYLKLIDYGGSLGSTFFRYKSIFSRLDVKWTIIEQKHFVEYGKKNIPEIEFKCTLGECEMENNVVLLSSVLSYLENPYDILNEIIERRTKYIVVDEQAFSENDIESIHLQNVPENIFYKAVYPVRLFSISEFRDYFEKRGYKIWEWDYKFGSIPFLKDDKYEKTLERGFFIYKI